MPAAVDYYINEQGQLYTADSDTGETKYIKHLPVPNPQTLREIVVVFDGGGDVLTADMQADVSIDFAATIVGWRLLADAVGNAEVDVWKDTFVNYPPDSTDSITGSQTPSLSSANHSETGDMWDWSPNISAGDTMRFNINSITTITRLTLILDILPA